MVQFVQEIIVIDDHPLTDVEDFKFLHGIAGRSPPSKSNLRNYCTNHICNEMYIFVSEYIDQQQLNKVESFICKDTCPNTSVGVPLLCSTYHVIGHNGGDPGTNTMMYFDAEKKTGKILVLLKRMKKIYLIHNRVFTLPPIYVFTASSFVLQFRSLCNFSSVHIVILFFPSCNSVHIIDKPMYL
mgnify:CR=1 FL=1